MDFRYKSELNEFFIRRENLEEISRIKVKQEDDEKNPILTPILMKYGKIFYLVFQIQNKGIYGIEILPDNKYGAPFVIMKMEEDQKFFKLVKCVSKNESDEKAGLLIEEPTGDIELNLLIVEKRCRISLVSKNMVWDRIPTVKLKIPGKRIFEIRNQNFCCIQVIVFDLSYLPVAAVGT